jgi:glycosyltransferase involved in cell wall biosynthesis
MANFGRDVVWDVDLLGGYESKLLRTLGHPSPQNPWTMLGLGLVRELQKSKYDVLVSYGWAYPSNWLTFALARARRIPFLLYGDTNVRDSGQRLPTGIRFPLIAALCRMAAGALYTGTLNRDFYVKHGMPPEQLWFSPYAVHTDLFASGDRGKGRQALGLLDACVYLLYVGSLIPRKRPWSVLNVARNLQRDGHSVGVIFAGSGELDASLRRKVAMERISDVHFLGFRNQHSLPEVYAAADILVVPSERDPRATVVNEAMAAARPVVVSTGTGVWGPGDLIQDGAEGYVFPTEREDLLQQACEALLDPQLRFRMGRLARAKAEQWSFTRAADGWISAAEAIVSGR